MPARDFPIKHFFVILAFAIVPGPTLSQQVGIVEARAAVDKGLERIKAGLKNYPSHRSCFSCHHQAVGILALTAARKHGVDIEDHFVKEVVDFSLNSFTNTKTITQGRGVGGDSVSVVYMLQTLAATERPGDETTGALVQYLLVRQRKDGHWPAPAQRPPTMGSPFTATGLALQALKKYGRAEDDAKSGATTQPIDVALDKGLAWLLANTPKSTEDRVFQLKGFAALAVDEERIAEARAGLLQQQRADGSWSQLDGKEGDAYATATALVALREAGLEASHSAYQRGVRYLLDSQREDGAWVVQTRSAPLQRFFDNGDAGGRSQFISFAATSWAVCAILETTGAKVDE